MRTKKPRKTEAELRRERNEAKQRRWLARRYRQVMRIIMEIEAGARYAEFTGGHSPIITDLEACGYEATPSGHLPGRSIWCFWRIRDPRYHP